MNKINVELTEDISSDDLKILINHLVKLSENWSFVIEPNFKKIITLTTAYKTKRVVDQMESK